MTKKLIFFKFQHLNIRNKFCTEIHVLTIIFTILLLILTIEWHKVSSMPVKCLGLFYLLSVTC